MQGIIRKLWTSSPASLTAAVAARVGGRRKGGWTTVQGGVLKGCELLLPDAGTVWAEMISGEYDKFIYEQPEVANLQGKVVWDVGAHIGYHSLAFAALGASVVAFEPNDANSERLLANVQRNTKLAPRIRHLKLALSDSEGEALFSQSVDLSGPSMGGHLQNATTPLNEEDYRQNRFSDTKVSVAKADDLIAKGELKPDILKIDVEGAEQLVLNGALKLLRSACPVLFMEVHHIVLMLSVHKMLAELGYEIELLAPSEASASRCFIRAARTKRQ